jgi:hypothetical protein
VVQRTGLHELASDAALDRPLLQFGVGPSTHLSRHHGEQWPQPLAAGHDEVRRQLVEVRVGRADRLQQRRLDSLGVLVHAGQS